MAIGQLHLGVLDHSLIVFDDTLVLMDRCHLGVELLFRDCILAVGRLVAIQINVRTIPLQRMASQ